MTETIKNRIQNFIQNVDSIETAQKANIQSKDQLDKSVIALVESNKLKSDELDICKNAITILRMVSDESVQKSYEFITNNINATLERIFNKATRKIRLREWTRSGQYPQLEVEVIVEGGKKRSLKSDSGHGLMQIISLLCILSLIVITRSRKIMVIDEVLSGLSAKSRKIIAEILWTFTEIGFQFIISEHGFVPKGSKVYHLQMDGGVSHVKEEYIESEGVYLDGIILENKTEYVENVDGEFKSGTVVNIE